MIIRNSGRIDLPTSMNQPEGIMGRGCSDNGQSGTQLGET